MQQFLRKIPHFSVWYIFLGVFTFIAIVEQYLVVCPAEPGCMLGRYLFSSLVIVSAVTYSLLILFLPKEKKNKKRNVYEYFFIGIVSVILTAVLLVIVLSLRLDVFLQITGLV